MSAPNISFETFLQQNGLARMWLDPNSPRESAEVGSLPLETLLNLQDGNSSPSTSSKASENFSIQVQNIQDHLLKARRGLVAVRSQESGTEQAQTFAAVEQEMVLAHGGLKKLQALARKLGPQERRMVRTLAGAPDWRRIRHVLKKQGIEIRSEVTLAA